MCAERERRRRCVSRRGAHTKTPNGDRIKGEEDQKMPSKISALHRSEYCVCVESYTSHRVFEGGLFREDICRLWGSLKRRSISTPTDELAEIKDASESLSTNIGRLFGCNARPVLHICRSLFFRKNPRIALLVHLTNQSQLVHTLLRNAFGTAFNR